MTSQIIDNKEEIDFFLPYLKGQNKLQILDIGCNDGLLLSNIYNNIPTNIFKLIGVDLYEEALLEIDSEDFIINHNSIVGSQKVEVEKVEIIKQDGNSYLEELKIEQNLIIFSNFLHLFPHDKSFKLLKKALSKLARDGIIFVKVRNKKMPFDKYPFDLDNIEEIKSFSKILAFKDIGIHYNLILQRN